MSNEYPKWVQRAPHIGAVLCTNAKEEQKLLEDWELEQMAAAEEAGESESSEETEETEGEEVELSGGNRRSRRR
jgi:hypothetical protein